LKDFARLLIDKSKLAVSVTRLCEYWQLEKTTKLQLRFMKKIEMELGI